MKTLQKHTLSSSTTQRQLQSLVSSATCSRRLRWQNHIPSLAIPVKSRSEVASFNEGTCERIGSQYCSYLNKESILTRHSRYNLKRRVASLPPLSSEVFAEKVLTAQASSSAVAAKASYEKACEACQKTYYSENAYQNHLGSQKHRLRAATSAKDSFEEETASVMSSTILVSEPAKPVSPEPAVQPVTEPIDPEAEAEFSKVIDGIKDTKLTDDIPVSRRPTRPHHSANEHRLEHPLSPEHVTESSAASTSTEGIPSKEIPLRKCLFCNYQSPTFKLNVMHMTKYHSMFIPEQIYLVNLEGLINWLYTRIHDLHECLYCHKTKFTTEAIQTHMRDTGHCKIAFEEENDMIDVGQFYDFSSTYSDPEEGGEADSDSHSPEKDGGVRIPDPRKVLKTVISNEQGEDVEMQNGDEDAEEGWETDSSASSLDSADLTAVPLDRRHMYKQERLQSHRHHSHDDPRRHRAVDGFHSHAHSHHAAFYSDHELHLPSGRTAGHRSLNRYFRQNLHNHPSPAERIEQQQQRLIEQVAREEEEEQDASMVDATATRMERGRQIITRTDGGLGMVGVTDAKKREVRALEQREAKRAQRAEKQYQWGVNKRANNQKHYRDPMLQ